ncbi:biotin transporter BioY [Metabacillus malikii]|uniref:Biotin transporter n=1 Tax=Metabacillus malikii TaxID=1504265 RepID=A0ABT9ZEP1_9BACI|nr:biotin transporter BioY [Metabacillus malikii]MDQ0230708.1 biotin transport system substrate-specific component [Metabacillus malikii]
MKLVKLMYVSMFAAIMGVLGLLPPIFTGITPVPITLQTLGVMLAGSILGARFSPKYAAYSQILFLLLVATGLPLLSGGRGGIGVFVSPSGGYLIGYVAAAYLIGFLIYHMKKKTFFKRLLVNIIGGIIVIYSFGIPIQAFVMDIPITNALFLSFVFLPGDLLKCIIATLLTVKMQHSRVLSERVTEV